MEGQIAEKLSVVQEHLPFYIGLGMHLLSAILIIITGWMLGNWADRHISGLKRLDETLSGFLGGVAKYTILAVAFVTLLAQFGVQTASLLAVLGGAALAVGLALQGTLSNVAAGTMMLVLRPFKVGDYIEFSGMGGTVKTLGLFGTELATADNVYIFAPNSQIWGNNILNYSKNAHRRQDILVSISYDDDITKAFKTIEHVLAIDSRILKEPADKKPQVVSDTMGDFSIKLIVRFWCQTSDYWALRWDITKAIKEALDAEGITIPFPTQIAIPGSHKKGRPV